MLLVHNYLIWLQSLAPLTSLAMILPRPADERILRSKNIFDASITVCGSGPHLHLRPLECGGRRPTNLHRVSRTSESPHLPSQVFPSSCLLTILKGRMNSFVDFRPLIFSQVL